MGSEKLKCIRPQVYSFYKPPDEMTWQEAKTHFAEVLAQKEGLVGDLVRCCNAEYRQTGESFWENVDILAGFIEANFGFRTVKNQLPRMFWESDDEEFVQAPDIPTENACVALGLYIADGIEEYTGGVLKLELHKQGKRSVYLNMPTIVILKGKVVLQPFNFSLIAIWQRLEGRRHDRLSEVLRKTVSYRHGADSEGEPLRP